MQKNGSKSKSKRSVSSQPNESTLESEEFLNEEEQEAVYSKMVQRIFFDHYRAGTSEFVFDHSEILNLKTEYDVEIPRNPGDLPYTFRFRRELPEAITKTQPKGLEWVIELAGRAKYRFKLARINRVLPRADLQNDFNSRFYA